MYRRQFFGLENQSRNLHAVAQRFEIRNGLDDCRRVVEDNRVLLFNWLGDMKIEKDTAVTLRLKISDTDGKVLDQASEPVAYLHGGYDNLFPKLEQALEGREAGFKTTVELQAQDAFGVRADHLVRTISKTQFPPGVKVGGQLELLGETGKPEIYRVVKIKGDKVMLDGNHPHADKALRVTMVVVSVRLATAEEITHGHVHGAHGHHH